jgi:UDP-N-acetylglucosamine 2-epimerase (non-hydrolysing)
VDNPAVLGPLVQAFGRIALELPLLFPVHPRTRSQLVDVPCGVQLVDPLGYLDFVGLQSGAAVVLTDSGGIQEETTALGVPCLTLRENTERPVTVTEGTNRVVGRDPEVVVAAALRAVSDPPAPRRPALWDGHAGERIAKVLLAAGPSGQRRRPTELRG